MQQTTSWNILAMDLSYGVAELALQTPTGQFHHQGEPGKTHSTELLPMLETLLQRGACDWDDLKLFALVVGPGSFTGLRIATATIAGLNSRLKLPVLPLSALAVTAIQSACDAPLYVCEDAHAGECYVGCYRQGHALSEDCCMPWSDVQQLPPSAFVARQMPPVALDGWQPQALTMSRGKAMLQLAAMQLDAIQHTETLPRYPQPVYLQPSQAERHARSH